MGIFLYGLSQILGYDLDEKIKKKMEINKKRIYVEENGKIVKKMIE